MAHYLTFESPITCLVNGTKVSSGYKLKDGDRVVARVDLNTTIYVNGEGHISGYTMDVSDTDIVVSLPTSGGTTPD